MVIDRPMMQDLQVNIWVTTLLDTSTSHMHLSTKILATHR